MRFFYCLAFVLCSLLLADAAQAFPWPVFIPVITNMGGQQCLRGDVSCTEQQCEGQMLYWYDGKCNKDKHPNQLKIEKMAGPWRLRYNYHGAQFDYYDFDINRVSKYPDPQRPNTYMISGVDLYGREASAYYTDITIPYYPFRAQYSIIDNNKYFLFDFINNNEITGTFRDKVDPDWEIHHYPLKGISRI